MKNTLLLLACACCAAFAQDNSLTAAVKNQYNTAKTNLIKAAEKMPEEDYAFKPTPAVRSFGELVGHVANASYMFCSGAAGEKSPATSNIEKTKTAKADLVAALKEAFAYCDKTYGAMTDAAGMEKVKFFGNEMPKMGVLTFNNMHDYEHYGNIVTYMRLKNIVPPSSEPKK